MLSTLLITTDMAMEQPFSQRMEQRQENSHRILTLAKLVWMFQFLFPYQCFHLRVPGKLHMRTPIPYLTNHSKFRWNQGELLGWQQLLWKSCKWISKWLYALCYAIIVAWPFLGDKFLHPTEDGDLNVERTGCYRLQSSCCNARDALISNCDKL